MTWDDRGRLWVAETVDYPNEMQPKGKGRDRITICEDTDGDGKADKFTVFADKLSIPTSLCYANGGLIVAQAPDMLFLKDTDGDDKADERKMLFTGLGTRDTHAGPRTCATGSTTGSTRSSATPASRGEVGGERHNFGQGFFRFKPDGSKLEFLRSTNNNSWGVGFSEEGLLFGSTANGCPSVYLPIPNRYYESVRGWSPSGAREHRRLEPLLPDHRERPPGRLARRVHRRRRARRSTRRAPIPKQYWNRIAFVAEPTGHLVATFTLIPDGSDFRSHNAWNLVASDDEWTSPILAEVGPGRQRLGDRLVQLHRPAQPDARGVQDRQGDRLRDAAARQDARADLSHRRQGRRAVASRPKLSKDDPKGLVAALKSDNMFWRLHAQRLLVERGKDDVASDLAKLIADRSVDATGLNAAARPCPVGAARASTAGASSGEDGRRRRSRRP